jgi:hypothetical protein
VILFYDISELLKIRLGGMGEKEKIPNDIEILLWLQ